MPRSAVRKAHREAGEELIQSDSRERKVKVEGLGRFAKGGRAGLPELQEMQG